MNCRIASIPALLLALASCETGLPSVSDIGAFREADVVLRHEQGPPGAAPGTCWGKEVSPAAFETVTEQFLVQPAQIMADGTVVSPGIYRTETVQRVVRERKETWFETPCPETMTEDFILSVQRALNVRGVYRGALTGRMDARTRAAIRKFQKPQGLKTSLLTLESGRQLGLIAVERDPVDQ